MAQKSLSACIRSSECSDSAHIRTEDVYCHTCSVFCCLKCLIRHVDHKCSDADDTDVLLSSFNSTFEVRSSLASQVESALKSALTEVSQQLSSIQQSEERLLSQLDRDLSGATATFQRISKERKLALIAYAEPAYDIVEKQRKAEERHQKEVSSAVKSAEMRLSVFQSCRSPLELCQNRLLFLIEPKEFPSPLSFPPGFSSLFLVNN